MNLGQILTAGAHRVLEHVEREADMPGLADKAKPLAEAGVGSLPGLAVTVALPPELTVGLELIRMAQQARANVDGPRTWPEYFDALRAQREREQKQEMEAAA